MKYCSHCGEQIMSEAVICPKCGCMVRDVSLMESYKSYKQPNGLQTAAKVLMIINCVLGGLLWLWLLLLIGSGSLIYVIIVGVLFGLSIDMTIKYFKLTEEEKEIKTSFKLVTLIFVSLIAGILMLCDKE